MSSDQRLLRGVACHFSMGGIMGALFACVIILTNMCNIGVTIAGADLPITTLVVFCVGPVLYFAFGAAVTGFLFLAADGVLDEKDRAS